MIRKLQTEVKRMQGLATTVHSADVSRLSTMMAAVNMGISTMRRRPLRTLLTAATVVLLTFTILTFASFGSKWGVRTTYHGPMSGDERILLRHQFWGPVSEDVYETLRGDLASEAVVVPRYWVSPTAQEVQSAKTNDKPLSMFVANADASNIVRVEAAVGLDTRDTDKQPALRRLLDGRLVLLKSDGIFLTASVSKALGLSAADLGKAKVLLAGHELTYAGTIKEEMTLHTLLEGSSSRPVDYQSSAGGGSLDAFAKQSDTQTLSEMPDIESAQFVRYGIDDMVIISCKAARPMGGRIRSVTIYPLREGTIRDLARRIAVVSQMPTYVGTEGGVYRMIFTSLASASGWRVLLVPVLLGGLIIFATMLGSVSDREREIYTFSSLGLAPPHVASLFFAEASVYAVIGGMGGYLLGQGVARFLGWLGSMGYVSVPTMNYSSTNAIVTILLVMFTVLVSTIYPALKASRSANPGIQRHWKIPRPEGGLYDLVFPFTVSEYDITGVVSFLREHFENYSDASLGCFTTTQCEIFRQADGDMLGFSAEVALAPFDLGVNQRFALLSQPSEIEGIDEVRILIQRTSGADGDWRRSNRVFINDLRKQLLIWRALPEEVMEKYRDRTLEQWDSLPRKQVGPENMGGTT